MQTHETFILTIPLSEQTNFRVDLLEIFEVIGLEFIESLVWRIEGLDCIGLEAQEVSDTVEKAGYLLLSGSEMLNFARVSEQTIEGFFVGYTQRDDASNLLNSSWTSRSFITSSAQIAIRAVDGSWFDVYTRVRSEAERLTQHFRNAQWNDSHDFLM